MNIFRQLSIVYLLFILNVNTRIKHINAFLFKKLGNTLAYESRITMYTSYKLSAVYIVRTRQSKYPLLSNNWKFGLALYILTNILLIYTSILVLGALEAVGLFDK